MPNNLPPPSHTPTLHPLLLPLHSLDIMSSPLLLLRSLRINHGLDLPLAAPFLSPLPDQFLHLAHDLEVVLRAHAFLQRAHDFTCLVDERFVLLVGLIERHGHWVGVCAGNGGCGIDERVEGGENVGQ
jgi:hypothetical protein